MVSTIAGGGNSLADGVGTSAGFLEPFCLIWNAVFDIFFILESEYVMRNFQPISGKNFLPCNLQVPNLSNYLFGRSGFYASSQH